MRGAAVPGLAAIAAAAALAGCGGSSGTGGTSSSAAHSTTATSPSADATPGAAAVATVCAHARATAARALGHPVTATITGRDPVDIRCRLRAGATRVAIEAQASAQAWVQFDTTQVHQVQAYQVGSHQVRGQIPVRVAAPGDTLAMWIPAQRQVFATNGGQTTAGSYVTVTVHGPRRAADRGLARSVTLAVLAVAPRGPRP